MHFSGKALRCGLLRAYIDSTALCALRALLFGFGRACTQRSVLCRHHCAAQGIVRAQHILYGWAVMLPDCLRAQCACAGARKLRSSKKGMKLNVMAEQLIAQPWVQSTRHRFATTRKLGTFPYLLGAVLLCCLLSVLQLRMKVHVDHASHSCGVCIPNPATHPAQNHALPAACSLSCSCA